MVGPGFRSGFQIVLHARPPKILGTTVLQAPQDFSIINSFGALGRGGGGERVGV